MPTIAEMQAEIMNALAELKTLAEGVETVKARLLVLYGRLEASCSPAPLPQPTPSPAVTAPRSPVDVMVRDLASGFPTDRDGFVVRITAGAGFRRSDVEAALAKLIGDGRVVEDGNGVRATVRIPRGSMTLDVPTKSPLTLAIEHAILHALDVTPGGNHATVIEAVARLHGVGRVMVQFILADMVRGGWLVVRPDAAAAQSGQESFRVVIGGAEGSS